jgi:hypothetical protein
LKTKIEAVALGAALVALTAVGALLAQENAEAPPPRPPVASTPPAATPPAATPPATTPPAAPGESAPAGPGQGVEDDVFIPTQELNADDQVTFPVDI